MIDRRELPTYTIAEAAHYLTVPAATIRYWSIGRGNNLPLINVPSPRSPTLISFLNLTELHVLSALRREHRVRMPGIRQAIEHLSKLAETPTDQRHPLVSRALETDGLDVFTEYYGQLINLSRSGQAVMREIIDGALKRIERDHGGIIESIRENAARVIVIRMKNATGPAIAEMLCGSMPRIARFVAATPAPFVASITSNGALRKIWPRDAGHEEDA